MKKIPSLFVRNADGVLTREYHPKAHWVIAGKGVATRKWDGTAVRIWGGAPFARYDAKNGKTPPANFVPCQDPDPVTGHWPGWVPAVRSCDVWIREAISNLYSTPSDWTYEACGPKIGGNPEMLIRNQLIRHGVPLREPVEPTWEALTELFATIDIEGIVWWRDPYDVDCDKVKITGAAMGIKRPR